MTRQIPMSPPTPSRLAIIADLVWNPPASEPQPGKALMISGGRIEALCDVSALPNDIDRIRFPGCTLLPGLIDCHAHLASWMIPPLLAAGVTTVRDIGNELHWILDLRRRLDADPRPTPRVRCCGPVLDGSHVNWPLLGEGHSTPEAVASKIDRLAEAGVNEIKLYVHLSFDQVKAAAEAGRRNALPVVAHLGKVNALQASRAGVAELQHLSGIIDPLTGAHLVEIDQVGRVFVENNTALCPTLVVWDRLARLSHYARLPDSRLRWVPAPIRTAWDAFPHRHDPQGSRGRTRALEEIEKAVATFYRAGVSIVTGTDAPWPYLIPGFSLHDEIVMLCRLGLSPTQVLTAATQEASRRLGIDHITGTLEAEKAADLLIVEGDPTADITHISRVREVFRGGRRVGVAALEPGVYRSGDPVNQSLIDYAEGRSRPQ